MKVWCLMILDDDDMGCTFHVFSSKEKAEAFSETIPNTTIMYEQVVDGAFGAVH